MVAFLGFRVGVELQPFCVENSKIDSILERTGFLGVSEKVYPIPDHRSNGYSECM